MLSKSCVPWTPNTYNRCKRTGRADRCPSNELASIIILCCNELGYTRPCLQSVLQHTRRPYELILIDNGSSDGTAEHLEELRQRNECVKVIHNAKNLGYPAGCNQGIVQAHGRYVVFLNNDTIVTESWLEGLIG